MLQLVVVVCVLLAFVINTCVGLNPILLVPGASGSAFESSPTGQNDWTRLWAAISRDLHMDTFLADMSMVYDPVLNTFTNRTGLEVRQLDFGGTGGVDYLDKVAGKGVVGTDYLEKMIAYFEKNAGYKRGVTIRAAPYDWRMATNHPQLVWWWVQVKALIEDMFADAGNSKVVVISHCYGGTTFSYWLPLQSQEWKDKYIKAHVVIAAPFEGVGIALEGVVSGTNDGYEFWGWSPIPLLKMRETMRTWGSVAAMLPTHNWGNVILVSSNTRNYTAKDLKQLFLDSGAYNESAMYDDTRVFEDYAAPGVWVSCHGAYNTPTPVGFSYPTGDFDQQAVPWFGDGDGTVAVSSAGYCNRWKGAEKTPFTMTWWDGIGHISLVKHEPFHEWLLTNVINGSAPSV